MNLKLPLAALVVLVSVGLSAQPPSFTIVEATIPAMQQAMAEGRLTSRELVALSLQRIAVHEDRLNAIITVNPKVLEQAEALDRERAAGKVRGPLHGIPIALKDNIHTTDMPTTGGALAFDGLEPPVASTGRPSPVASRGSRRGSNGLKPYPLSAL